MYDEQGQLLGEYEFSGKPIQETVYLGNKPIAVLKQSTAGTVVSTDIHYVYTDHINTPRIITRATDNKMVWRWDNTDPFGVIQPNENPAGLGAFTYNPRFPGQVYDAETGLYYNYHRSYNPSLGAYIQSDPIGLDGGISTYGYVGGNPVNFVDPSGTNMLAGAEAGAEIGGAVGGVPGAIVGGAIGGFGGVVVGNAISDSISGNSNKCDCNYYHYTNYDGYLGIINSDYTIRANEKGMVYVTREPMSAAMAESALFMGGYGSYKGKGDYVIQFTMPCDLQLFSGTQPNEFIYFGSLRLGRQINKIIYSGPNTY